MNRPQDSRTIIGPRTLDAETLTAAHVLLCKLEAELTQARRAKEADLLAYVDLVVLTLRNLATRRQPQ
jgi:hypothetical protein